MRREIATDEHRWDSPGLVHHRDTEGAEKGAEGIALLWVGEGEFQARAGNPCHKGVEL